MFDVQNSERIKNLPKRSSKNDVVRPLEAFWYSDFQIRGNWRNINSDKPVRFHFGVLEF